MEEKQTRRSANVPAVIVGVFAIGTALLGLSYNAMSVSSALSGVFDSDDTPYFNEAFFLMSAICVSCQITLLVCGIDLVRSKLRWSRLVTLLLFFELGYVFAVGTLWLEPTIGRSVAAATGVANGGLMFQFFVLLPLWGPLLLWWTKSKERHQATQG